MIKRRQLPDDILERLQRLTSLLNQDQRVQFAYLFGGLASGVLKPLSDVDVAVYLDATCVNSHTKLDFTGIISDILGTDEIDLVVLNSASVSLTGRIMKQRKVISDNKPYQRHLFESRVMREYFDFSRKESEILARRFA